MEAADVRALPARIESLLDGIAQAGGPDLAERAEDLVGAVLTLYGEGLTRIVGELDEQAVRELAADELIGNLLMLHDLHPVSRDVRIQAALDRVRPYLGSHAGGIDFVGVDEDGVAHLRLQGSCDSCPSSTATVQGAIEKAVLDAAPDIAGLDVMGMVEPPPSGGLLQIASKPPQFDSCPVPT